MLLHNNKIRTDRLTPAQHKLDSLELKKQVTSLLSLSLLYNSTRMASQLNLDDIDERTFAVPVIGKQTPKCHRRVHFSESSTLHVTVAPDQNDINSSWYSRAEGRAMKRQLAMDIQRMRQIVTNLDLFGPGSPISRNDIIHQCIGLEKFLSLEVSRNAMRNRERHYDNIFSEQDRQWTVGIQDVDMLRRISEAGSSPAMQRAAEFGARYYEMDVSSQIVRES